MFRTDIEPTHCPEVALSSRYCAIFGCCNINEYYNYSPGTICILFSSYNFIDIPIKAGMVLFAGKTV